ncbi:MAG: hypothetical protein A2406_02940 [Candidatus Komeilibacteria bacterium RIFOXYC1_FULL_37_11]|uniref:DoxX family protein n=1 Tax=Candidatus Komeilibacteria bacterium RIFOXYC1_FULL_37_11 TaxID=1798555 RepID=A0A1G2BZF9_9BACT|nr:MAG: hypothetical protein A2406_02940 [Candidatus Komeilibacteria bacterium RIFOXYC1_FULL_37_11]OGY95691.1 MAG: hypothetical protein A2611_02825 [Candidatus Komeilibacteria bacterium RIFOXYD1_FULL_37_29]
MKDKLKYSKGLLRIFLGWLLLWAFLDKVFGLSFTTEADKSWLGGTSPTLGFLKFGSSGPFKEIFQAMAGQPLVDWLFMLGLLFIGLALILGIASRLATLGGAMMFALMYLAVLPPEHNPLVDEHIIYILILMGLYIDEAGNNLGLGQQWQKCPLVKNNPWLK